MDTIMLRRFWLPFASAILIISLIEASIFFIKKPTFWEKTSWLLHDPYRGEPFDRLIVYEKLSKLVDEKPDVISVGDSSGFFSIQPNIVNRYLHGMKYVSLSTGANQAFQGYKAIAEFALNRQPSIKYVVLNMFPALLPSKEVFRKADLAPIEYSDLASYQAMLTPPSASLSPYFKSLFFYHKKYNPKDLPSSHKVYLEVHHSIQQTLGWAPEHDIPFDRILQITPFYKDIERRPNNLYGAFDHKSEIIKTFNDFADMCRKHHVKLLIMFNPMPWQTIANDDNLFLAEKRLKRFQRENPDVIFLTQQLVNPWDPAKFGMYNHVSRAYVHESSARMGKAVEKAIFNPQAIKPFAPNWKPRHFPVPTDVQVVGKATEAQKNAAFAYYMYTASTDTQYKTYLSSRVQSILNKDQPFNWMMDDMRAKNDYLAKQDILLMYDNNKVDADIVSLKNGYYCGHSKNVTWVRLSGEMQFKYKSHEHVINEPVQWPTSSNIIIPIIKEGNTYKFDGYCQTQPENMEVKA